MLFEVSVCVFGLFMLLICRGVFMILNPSKRKKELTYMSCKTMVVVGSGIDLFFIAKMFNFIV